MLKRTQSCLRANNYNIDLGPRKNLILKFSGLCGFRLVLIANKFFVLDSNFDPLSEWISSTLFIINVNVRVLDVIYLNS